MNKLTIVGNIGGGKTVLSKKLAACYNLPLVHVDDIQFLPNMTIRPLNETRQQLNKIVSQEKWLIDGYGPLDLLEARFALADKIIFIDLPISRHFWWCTKRVIKNLIKQNNQAKPSHIIKQYKTLWAMHKKMRPELLKVLNRPDIKNKMLHIKKLKQWQNIFLNGI